MQMRSGLHLRLASCVCQIKCGIDGSCLGSPRQHKHWWSTGTWIEIWRLKVWKLIINIWIKEKWGQVLMIYSTHAYCEIFPLREFGCLPPLLLVVPVETMNLICKPVIYIYTDIFYTIFKGRFFFFLIFQVCYIYVYVKSVDSTVELNFTHIWSTVGFH